MAVDPAPFIQEVPRPNGEDKTRGSFRPASDLTTIEPPSYNIDGLLQKGTTALLWGLPGACKTTAAMDWWCSGTLGRSWCRRSVSKGIGFYIPLEDRAGFRARWEAWRDYYEQETPPWTLWWDGEFSFDDSSVMALIDAMKACEQDHGLPVTSIYIDPIMKVYGEGTALDEADFRQRLDAIEKLRTPFPEATAVVTQHAGWDNKHELGSIIQRALTATSIKAFANGNVVTLKVVRQKNDEEGLDFTFEKQSLGDKGKLVLVPTDGTSGEESFAGYANTALEALQEVVLREQDKGHRSGTSGTSPRCPVDAWRTEFQARCVDGGDIKRDTLKHRFNRAADRLKAAGKVGFRGGEAWLIY